MDALRSSPEPSAHLRLDELDVTDSHTLSATPWPQPVILDTARGSSLATTVRAVLPFSTSTVSDRDAFHRSVGFQRVGIVCMDSIRANDLAWLSSLVACGPESFIVLVTPLTKPTAEALASFRRTLPDIIWADDVPDRLCDRVRECSERGVGFDLIEYLSAKLDSSPLITNALQRISRAVPPITSVQALADSMGLDRRTLHTYWISDAPGGPTLKEVLDWVVLCRAAELSDRSLTALAFDLGVHRRTLERLVGRRLAMSAAAFRRAGPGTVIRALHEALDERLG
jgi:hypothetical protein